MAIYAIGAYYDEDVSQDFIESNLIGVGWNNTEAPELHQFIMSLKVGDIVYLKSYSPSSSDIIVKGVGYIIDNIIITRTESGGLVNCGRNVRWIFTELFRIPKPIEKNNVRANAMYEEFHPEVQRVVLEHFRV
jgi:hypothetical protein